MEPVLGGLEAVGQEGLGGVGCEVDGELQLLLLRTREALEHEVGGVLATGGTADAEADAESDESEEFEADA